MTLGCLMACEFYEPPSDIEPSTSTSAADDAGDDDPVVYDGGGLGVIYFPRLRDAPTFADSPLPTNTIVVGAPHEAWEGVNNSGQVSILLDNKNEGGLPAQAIGTPENSPRTIVEKLHSPACTKNHRFAWDLQPERRLGAAMSFASLSLGADFGAYENMLLIAAPTAGANSGRVMT